MRRCTVCEWTTGFHDKCRVQILLMASWSESHTVRARRPSCLAIQRQEYIESAVREARRKAGQEFDGE